MFGVSRIRRQLLISRTSFLMAGGRGQQLYPMTHNTPANVAINGKPMIEHTIEMFMQHGIQNFVISLVFRRSNFRLFW